MITELPTKIRHLLLNEHIINVSRELLEPFRTAGVEGCLLWFGLVLDSETCFVTSCIRPPQENRRQSYAIPSPAIRAVRQQVRPHGLLLLMQIHTHPRQAFFSEWDAENALNKRPGALNMVIPDFGNVQWIDRSRFCLVELDDQDIWQPWSRDDWQRLRVIPDSIDLLHST
jgi:hypothetical protein